MVQPALVSVHFGEEAMRDLVQGLVTRKRTRRDFLTEMLAAGYTLPAARSALASVSPFVQDGQASESLTRTMTGTGGELLAEQLIEAGAKYMFVSNGSGLGALCERSSPGLRFS